MGLSKYYSIRLKIQSEWRSPLALLQENVINLQARGCEPGTGVACHKDDRCNARLGQDYICHDRGIATACGGWAGRGRECIGQDVLKTTIAFHTTYKPAEDCAWVRASICSSCQDQSLDCDFQVTIGS